MSEFFLELFSEEIPANLQKNARKNLLQNFKDFFRKKDISFNKEISFSTPNRLLILFDGIKPEIHQKEQEIRMLKDGIHILTRVATIAIEEKDSDNVILETFYPGTEPNLSKDFRNSKNQRKLRIGSDSIIGLGGLY